MITVRPARPEDAPAIQLLNAEGMGYSCSLEKTKTLLESLCDRDDHCILVAELDADTVVGYIHLEDYQTLYFDPMKNILGIAVFTEFRRRGIAAKLITAGEQWARDTGAVGVRLVSGYDRDGAHAFYERMGYQMRKLQKNYRKEF